MKRIHQRLIVAASLTFLVSLQAFAGANFYFTFERSFSPEEAVELRLDYTMTRTPLRIRILKPDNVDTFLDGQFAISRSYEQPRASLNPGHFFARGINQLNAPFEALRRLFSASVRDKMGEGADNPLQTPNYKRTVYIPPAINIDEPAGFKVQKELFVDLQRGGTKKKDVVPGFEDWWGGYISTEDVSDFYGGTYTQRSITIGKLPAGIYLVQGIQGANEGQAILQVSDVSLQVKQSNQQVQVRAIDRKGMPVSGVKISLRDMKGHWEKVKEPTNGSGEILVSETKPFDSQLVVKAEQADGNVSLSDTEFLANRDTSSSMFLFTDRPIFKPGDAFSFKGIFRTRGSNRLEAPNGKTNVEMSLNKADGTMVGSSTHGTLNSFGSVSGGFTIPETTDPGVYQVKTSLKTGAQDQSFAGELRIRDYVKPTYYLESGEESGQLRPGETYKIKLKAVRYSGGAPANTKYDYFVYRKKYSVPEFVEDAGMGIQTGTDYFGGAQNAKALSQPERIFSSVDERQKNSDGDSEDPWSTAAAFDAKGEANIEVALPADPKAGEQEWVYVLSVRAKDAQGSAANFSKESLATKTPAVGRVVVAKALMQSGDKNSFGVMSFYPDGRSLGKVSGRVVIAGGKGWSFVTDDQGRAKIDWDDNLKPGRYAVSVELDKMGDKKIDPPFKGEPETLLVAGHAGEAIGATDEFATFGLKTQLNPGEKTKILVLLPDQWGQNNKGSLWVTVAGDKIHKSQHTIAEGRSAWIDVEADPNYGTAFYAMVSIPVTGGKYLEQTVPFRIVPDSKILKVAIKPSQAVATPMTDFPVSLTVTDTKGAPVPNAELAVSVVDRAVYAVQQEFRPKILDFFYPMTRLNVMTFYSDNLQGLGYSEAIRRPNFKLGAMKLNSLLKKLTERDTAGWFPHVVTDASGNATVTVSMPSNLTEWLVTAVVIDEQGRVGENTTKFRTTKNLFAEPSLPKFIRSGDLLQAPVRIAQNEKDAKQVSLNAVASNGLTLLTDAKTQATVPPNSETTVHYGLKAEGEGVKEATLALTLTGPGISALRPEIYALPVRGSQFHEKVLMSQLSDKNFLQTMVPEAAQVKSIQVVAADGLFGALLDKVDYLVRYPYGCTEQLSHSTMPNLVMLDIMKQLGQDKDDLSTAALQTFFGPLAAQAAEAKKNALSGLARIAANRNKDGGFGMWSSTQASSMSASLLAYEVFEYAQKIGLISYGDAKLSVTKNYLAANFEKQNFDKMSGDADMMLYANYFENEYYTLPKNIVTYVNGVFDNPNPSLYDSIMTARLTRQIYTDTFKANFGKEQKATMAALYKKISATILAGNFDKMTFANDGWSEMGFRVSPSILLAMAIQVLDKADALTDDVAMKLKQGLILALSSDDFYSTYNLGQTLSRSRALIIKELKQKRPDGDVRLTDASGKKLGTLTSFAGGYAATLTLPEGSKGEQLSELRLEGSPKPLKLFGQLDFVTPNEQVTETKQGMSVTRELYRVTNGKAELLTDVDLQKLNIGDVIVSRVTADNAAGKNRQSRYVVVSDPVPSFAESIDDDRTYLADGQFKASEDSYWSKLRDTYRRPDRLDRVFENNDVTTQISLQVWRVKFEGEASLPPAAAFDMYRESVQGHSKGMRLKVGKAG